MNISSTFFGVSTIGISAAAVPVLNHLASYPQNFENPTLLSFLLTTIAAAPAIGFIMSNSEDDGYDSYVRPHTMKKLSGCILAGLILGGALSLPDYKNMETANTPETVAMNVETPSRVSTLTPS